MNHLIECLTPWTLLINQFTVHTCGDMYRSGIPTDSYSFIDYIQIFIKTLILEFPIYFILLRVIKSWKEILLINFLINLATHPLIFLVMPLVFARYDLNYLQYLAIAETFAPTVEALLLILIFKVNWRYAISSALLANLFSWGIGIYWS